MPEIDLKDKYLGKSADYWDGVKEGQKHTSPSKETIRLIEELTLEVKQVTKDQKDFSESITQTIEKIDEHLDKAVRRIDASLVDMDKRSVNWDNTQKIVYGMVALLLTSVIGALIALILK